MISHTLLRDDGVLLLHPEAPLEASDFQQIAGEVDPYIAEHGNLQGLMVVAERFPGWRNFAGFRSQVRFVRNHFAKIKKIAAVTDDKLLSVFPRMMSFMLGRKFRHFAHADRETALALAALGNERQALNDSPKRFRFFAYSQFRLRDRNSMDII